MLGGKLSGLTSDPLTQIAFSIHENRGAFALLLGSGLSRAASIPTGWEITLDLIRRIALAQGVEEQTDWADWYRKLEGQEPSYSALLKALAASPAERRSVLHSYIEPSDTDREEGRKLPTLAHREIAALVQRGYIRVIVTTNFDRLLESALKEKGIEPTVVASVDALSGAQPMTHSMCYILKLHGDYLDARILNTEDELNVYPQKYAALLDRIFDEYGLIVCGWSGDWDHALRAAFLRTPNRRYPVYWASRSSPSESAQGLINHRAARTVTISDADSFFAALRERVDALEVTRRQDPTSVELLVNTTKRYLGKPEYRIKLDELFSRETERLLATLESPDFSASRGWDTSDFRTRVSRYEACAEPLARMVGALGRWGDGSELGLVLDILQSVYADAEKVGGGLTVYLNLRSYPAVLIFTSYGLGLTRAKRWPTLHKLFDAIIAREHRESRRAVETLFLWAWKGTESDVWKQIEGLDRRKTPLSDHLLEIFKEWARSFIGVLADFELMFERYELLGSLAHFERNAKGDLQAELATQDRNDFAWMPVGRVGWHESNAEKLLSELQADGTREVLLKAGFAKGDPELLQLFQQNFKRVAGRMRW